MFQLQLERTLRQHMSRRKEDCHFRSTVSSAKDNIPKETLHQIGSNRHTNKRQRKRIDSDSRQEVKTHGY